MTESAIDRFGTRFPMQGVVSQGVVSQGVVSQGVMGWCRSARPHSLLFAMGMLLAFVGLAAAAAVAAQADEAEHREVDLLIVGGTESGCAAAVQAARMGVGSILLVNDIDWLGGQFSAEGLGAIDENRGPQGYNQTVPFPRSGLFLEVIERLEALNLSKYGRAQPGNTRVITTGRPADAEQVFRDLLAPYIASGRVSIASHYAPASASVVDDRLRNIRFHDVRPASLDPSVQAPRPDLVVSARVTIDASDWGDAIQAAGAEYEFGPDLQSKYGEPLAPTSRENYPLTDMNPITYCMIIEETDRYEPISQPAHYDRRSYDAHAYPKDPLWLYASRRLIDHYNFPQVDHPDVLLLCFPAFDYPLDVLPAHVAADLEATEVGASRKNIVEMNRVQRQIVFDDAKQFALGFLYYLQTVVHDQMPDTAHSFRRFQLSDEFPTPDRLPPKPYVRESLRLRAMYMMRQQDTTGWRGRAENYAQVMYHDGVGCWQFEYDFHPTGREFLDEQQGPAGPWRNYFRAGRTWGPPYSGRSLLPLRSLIPERVDGLLGGQKNLGYSSIVSSALRLHDQSMMVGQAAGAAAAVALRHDVPLRELPYDRALLNEIRHGLCSRLDGGRPLALWPFADVGPEHPAFEAINLLAIRSAFPLRGDEVKFQPDLPITDEWRAAVIERSLATVHTDEVPDAPDEATTRGEFAQQWWQRLETLPVKPWPRTRPVDADGDGIADRDDGLPLDSNPSSWPAWQPAADEDGNPDPLDSTVDSPGRRRFNFTGIGSNRVDGFTSDHGLTFDAERGHGWLRDISSSHRRRGRLDGDWRDTFLFTRSHDVWECELAPGRYRVTVCIGDSGHEQFGQNVTVEGCPVLRDRLTPAGEFAEAAVDVEVRDGRLTIEIGLPGRATNTCLNWLTLELVAGD